MPDVPCDWFIDFIDFTCLNRHQMSFSWDLHGYNMGSTWGPLGATGSHWGPLGPTGAHWSPLGTKWGPLGPTGRARFAALTWWCGGNCLSCSKFNIPFTSIIVVQIFILRATNHYRFSKCRPHGIYIVTIWGLHGGHWTRNGVHWARTLCRT